MHRKSYFSCFSKKFAFPQFDNSIFNDIKYEFNNELDLVFLATYKIQRQKNEYISVHHNVQVKDFMKETQRHSRWFDNKFDLAL